MPWSGEGTRSRPMRSTTESTTGSTITPRKRCFFCLEFRSVVFGFVLGGVVLNSFNSLLINLYVSDAMVRSRSIPCKVAGGDKDVPFWNDPELGFRVRAKTKPTIIPTIIPVDCRNFSSPNDPNARIPPNSTIKFVEKTDPTFWIALHEQNFDELRWNTIAKKGEYYETHITAQFREILWGQPKGIVIDIGMNIGWYTLYSRAMGHMVVGFDPNPIMHSRVCESLQLNGWWDGGSSSANSNSTTISSSSSGVTTFAFGLGDQSGITLNLTMARNPGASSFHKERLNAVKFRRQVEVPVTTLDDFAVQMGWIDPATKATTTAATPKALSLSMSLPIHLLKIDVEGYESWVVRGGIKLLRSGKVRNILMESSTTDTAKLLDLFRTLWGAGYKLRWIEGVGSRPTNEALADGSFFERDNRHLRVFLSEARNLWWEPRPR